MTDLSLQCPAPPTSSPQQIGSFRALLEGSATTDLLRVGVAASVEGLREVLVWAAAGQQADETATLWLQQLRWARACGLPLDPAAPLPPADPWEARVPRGTVAQGIPEFAETLGRSTMQYPARSQDRHRSGAEFLPLLVPLVFHPQPSLVHLGQLSVNATALTHGHPEALATGLVWTLALRCGADEERAPEHWFRAGCPRVAELLVPDQPVSAPPGGLMAAMAATGGSLRALQAVLAAAPGTRSVLLGEPGPAEDHACVAALRACSRGMSLGQALGEGSSLAPQPASGPVAELLREAEDRWLEAAAQFRALG